ncbi:MAG: peptide chain release factor N(5)-glutamine methyltransferase [Ignavibacteriae bacterium]|nr:peptide chain release factor N(5)-glutamine methyltransferase [Ignavibacteriota bacterium]
MQSSSAPPSEKKQAWTVLTLIEWSTQHLLEHGFDEARLHVELLLAHVLTFSRLQLYTNFDRPLTPDELSRFKVLFKRRLTHEPLQYILGTTEFMGLTFEVNENVLIPRPETELLVEKALEVIASSGIEPRIVLDIGTGSGAVGVAIARCAANARVASIDISEPALEVAERNAQLNGVTVEFLRCDMMTDFLPDRAFHLIVSNPPYVSSSEFALLQPEVRDFEPRIATTDEGDGFKYIRRLLELARLRLLPGGTLLFEMAFNQSATAMRIASEAGLRDVQIFDDMAGIPRVLSARR